MKIEEVVLCLLMLAIAFGLTACNHTRDTMTGTAAGGVTDAGTRAVILGESACRGCLGV
jgi:hypothetical protein